jgi:hypothetical protein
MTLVMVVQVGLECLRSLGVSDEQVLLSVWLED